MAPTFGGKQPRLLTTIDWEVNVVMEDPRRRGPGYISLRDAVNQLFEGSVVSPGRPRQDFEGITPPVDVHETEDAYHISMAVPGADPDKINVSAQGRTLIVAGTVERRWQRERAHVHYQEIETGHFSRSFTLGDDVDVDQADASFDNGILSLTLPKAQTARPRSIKVTSGRAGAGQGTPIQGQESAGSETKLEG